MTIKIPWVKVGLLLGSLVKAAKGGIDKEEAQDLLSDLAEIAAHIALQLAQTK
jgi:hypothetical protein